MLKINTALLSFGMSGKVFHAPFLHQHTGFNLMGCWERSKRIIAEQYKDVKSYLTLESLLSDPKVELVIVNTPSYTHYEYARQSLLAAKHTVVEKPFTGNAREAQELVDLAKAMGVKLSVFQNRRWDSDFKTVRSILDRKLLGDIVEASISWDRFNAALSPKVHKETPSSGSGVVKDLGPHLIDQALVLFGMPGAVFADVRITRPNSQVDDYFEILLFYPNHRVRLRSGYFVREPAPAYIFHGTKGSFLKTRADTQEVQLSAGAKPGDVGYGIEPETEQGLIHTDVDGKTVKQRVGTLPGNYMDYYDGIYKSLTTNAPPPVTGTDGLNVMRIIDATMISSAERKVIDI